MHHPGNVSSCATRKMVNMVMEESRAVLSAPTELPNEIASSCYRTSAVFLQSGMESASPSLTCGGTSSSTSTGPHHSWVKIKPSSQSKR